MAQLSYRPGKKPAGLVKSRGNEVFGGERDRQSLAAVQGHGQQGIPFSNIKMHLRLPATLAYHREGLFQEGNHTGQALHQTISGSANRRESITKLAGC